MNKQTQETQEQRWKRIGDTYYLKFSEITTKKSQRPDLHAFQLLDEIFPDTNDIISCTTHYMIFLDFGEKESEKLTDDQIIELSRCGIFYNEDSLCMFV